ACAGAGAREAAREAAPERWRVRADAGRGDGSRRTRARLTRGSGKPSEHPSLSAPGDRVHRVLAVETLEVVLAAGLEAEAGIALGVLLERGRDEDLSALCRGGD